MAEVTDLRVSAEQAARQARRLGLWARVVLVPVAVIGAVLSFQSLYQAAVPTFGAYLAIGFPLLVDLLILGASLQYVAGAKIGQPMAGWRLTAHAGVAGTLVLNALAAKELGEVPWHITAPAVWAVLVELTAKQVLGEWKATHAARADSISLPLWMTAPIESVRTRLLMFRTGITDAHRARIAVGVNAAAREALRLALPKRNARRVRRIINRQLRAGSLTPVAILRPLGWTKGGVILNDARPDVILQAVLQEVLDPGAPAPATTATPAARVMVAQPQQPIDQLGPEQSPEEPGYALEPEVEAGARPGATDGSGVQRQGPAPQPAVEPQPAAFPLQQPAFPQQQQPVFARQQQPTFPQQQPAFAPQQQAFAAQEPAFAPQQQAFAAQEPAFAPRAGVAPQPDMTQPVDADRWPGTVQQPERALQFGRALHRGRVLHQTGSADGSVSAAEQLRSELTKVNRPQPGQPQFAPRSTVQPDPIESPEQQPWIAQEPVRTQPMRPERAVEQPPGTERSTRPVETFLAPTAVLGLDDARQSNGRPGDGRVDQPEVLEDMEHLDELDGQYPNDFDGLDRDDFIDLDVRAPR